MFKTSTFCRYLMLFSFLLLPLLSGCEKPPADKLIRAEKAIDEAKQSKADLYATDVILQAEQTLQKAKEFVASKNYTAAKMAADDAVQLAKESTFIAEHNKAKMKTEAEQIVQEVECTLDEIKSLLAKAINKKKKSSYLEIQETIGTWENDLENIKNDLQAEKIFQAYNALKELQEQISNQQKTIVTSLTTKRRRK